MHHPPSSLDCFSDRPPRVVFVEGFVSLINSPTSGKKRLRNRVDPRHGRLRYGKLSEWRWFPYLSPVHQRARGGDTAGWVALKSRGKEGVEAHQGRRGTGRGAARRRDRLPCQTYICHVQVTS